MIYSIFLFCFFLAASLSAMKEESYQGEIICSTPKTLYKSMHAQWTSDGAMYIKMQARSMPTIAKTQHYLLEDGIPAAITDLGTLLDNNPESKIFMGKLGMRFLAFSPLFQKAADGPLAHRKGFAITPTPRGLAFTKEDQEKIIQPPHFKPISYSWSPRKKYCAILSACEHRRKLRVYYLSTTSNTIDRGRHKASFDKVLADYPTLLENLSFGINSTGTYFFIRYANESKEPQAFSVFKIEEDNPPCLLHFKSSNILSNVEWHPEHPHLLLVSEACSSDEKISNLHIRILNMEHIRTPAHRALENQQAKIPSLEFSRFSLEYSSYDQPSVSPKKLYTCTQPHSKTARYRYLIPLSCPRPHTLLLVKGEESKKSVTKIIMQRLAAFLIDTTTGKEICPPTLYAQRNPETSCISQESLTSSELEPYKHLLELAPLIRRQSYSGTKDQTDTIQLPELPAPLTHVNRIIYSPNKEWITALIKPTGPQRCLFFHKVTREDGSSFFQKEEELHYRDGIEDCAWDSSSTYFALRVKNRGSIGIWSPAFKEAILNFNEWAIEGEVRGLAWDANSLILYTGWLIVSKELEKLNVFKWDLREAIPKALEEIKKQKKR